MRKLFYLLMILTAIFTSCEKDDSNTDNETDGANDGLMTLAELSGQWYVATYQYDGILWTVESNIPSNYNGLEDIFDWDWNFNIGDMTTECGGYFTYDFSKNGNTIKISYQGDNLYTYTIISYSENQLSVIYEDNEEDRGLFNYKGGTITFVK